MSLYVMLYVRLVEMGSRTIDEVPAHLREEVAVELAKRNPEPEEGGS